MWIGLLVPLLVFCLLARWIFDRKCPFCRKAIARKAVKCPHCQSAVQSAGSPLLRACILFLVLAIGVAALVLPDPRKVRAERARKSERERVAQIETDRAKKAAADLAEGHRKDQERAQRVARGVTLREPYAIVGKYGSVTIPKGSRLPILNVGGETIRVKYASFTPEIPIAITDWQ